jgi:hypothetical protein
MPQLSGNVHVWQWMAGSSLQHPPVSDRVQPGLRQVCILKCVSMNNNCTTLNIYNFNLFYSIYVTHLLATSSVVLIVQLYPALHVQLR